MATHSSILAQRIPWTEEPGRLQSMGSQRVRHNWVRTLHRERNSSNGGGGGGGGARAAGGGNRLKTGTWPIPGTESIKIQIVHSLPFEPSQDPTQQLFSLASEKVFSSLFWTIKVSKLPIQTSASVCYRCFKVHNGAVSTQESLYQNEMTASLPP